MGNAAKITLGMIILALAFLTVVFISAAGAQETRNCGPREMVLQRLTEGYGETRHAMGLGANNAVVEVFASDETGSWTITVTSVNGLTCLVASGQSFEALFEELPASGEDL